MRSHGERDDIFRDLSDRERFLATLDEACGKTGWEVHAYCIMSNHFHPVIEIRVPMEERRKLDDPESFKTLSRGWRLGGEEFRKELLARMLTRVRRTHSATGRRGSAEQGAARLLKDELTRRGWSGDELQERRKGDQHKVRIARRLRTETTMTWAWIAKALKMGSPGYVANCVRAAKPPVEWLRAAVACGTAATQAPQEEWYRAAITRTFSLAFASSD